MLFLLIIRLQCPWMQTRPHPHHHFPLHPSRRCSRLGPASLCIAAESTSMQLHSSPCKQWVGNQSWILSVWYLFFVVGSVMELPVTVFGYSHFSDFDASLQSCKSESLLLQVFNMNAPVPPVNEPETLKQQNQYQASYNQSFSNQPHQVEQSDLQQEQLQTGKIFVALVQQVVSLWSSRWWSKACHRFPCRPFAWAVPGFVPLSGFE